MVLILITIDSLNVLKCIYIYFLGHTIDLQKTQILTTPLPSVPIQIPHNYQEFANLEVFNNYLPTQNQNAEFWPNPTPHPSKVDDANYSNSPLESGQNSPDPSPPSPPPYRPQRKRKGAPKRDGNPESPKKRGKTQKSPKKPKTGNEEPKNAFSKIVHGPNETLFFEGFEILKQDSGFYKCSACGWEEGWAGKAFWQKMQAIKMHISGVHLGKHLK